LRRKDNIKIDDKVIDNFQLKFVLGIGVSKRAVDWPASGLSGNVSASSVEGNTFPKHQNRFILSGRDLLNYWTNGV
jgi:hypothetical protein